MAEQARNAAFAAMRNDPTNKVCIDCGANNPQWASVSLGILFCLDVTMDSWSEKQLASMKAGGNANCKAFFRSQGVQDDEFRRLSIKERYDSQTGALYREKLKASVEGRTFDLAKARAQVAADHAAAPPPRHAQSMPQLPSVSAARSSAALPIAPAPAATSSVPPARSQPKKNEWDDDWDALLNDKPAGQPGTPDNGLNRSGSMPRLPAEKSQPSSTTAQRREARSPDVFSPVALQDSQQRGGRDEEAEERLRRLGMADAPRASPARDWRDATPPEDAAPSSGGGGGGGADYYGMLAQGWNSLASTAVTYGSAAAKDKLSTIDTTAVKGYVQPIASAPVVQSVSNYLGSWWSGGDAGAGPSQGSTYPYRSASSGGGVQPDVAPQREAGGARKEEGADWSQWGWGAEGKEKDETPKQASNGNGKTDDWGDWSEDSQGAAKPRRAVTGKRD